MDHRPVRGELSQPLEQDLSRLAIDLGTLRAAIRTGDWEQVVALSESMMPTLDSLRRIRIEAAITPGQRRKIDDALNALGLAIQECTVRKAQLVPLIDALDNASDRPDRS